MTLVLIFFVFIALIVVATDDDPKNPTGPRFS